MSASPENYCEVRHREGPFVCGNALTAAIWSVQSRSDSMGALAEDHLNDVVSNAGAIITATIAYKVPGAWFIDPIGAIVISLWIISRWIGLTYVQVRTFTCCALPDCSV